jgi:hypothetical protein
VSSFLLLHQHHLNQFCSTTTGELVREQISSHRLRIDCNWVSEVQDDAFNCLTNLTIISLTRAIKKFSISSWDALLEDENRMIWKVLTCYLQICWELHECRCHFQKFPCHKCDVKHNNSTSFK